MPRYFANAKYPDAKSLPGLANDGLLKKTKTRGDTQRASVKPVLNCGANVCSPNILRTVWRTMIRFLIELLVRRTWFGQFDKLYFVLNWLVMRCKLRPEHAADAQQTAWSTRKCMLKSSQYTLIIPHRVIQLTTISFWFHETTLRFP